MGVQMINGSEYFLSGTEENISGANLLFWGADALIKSVPALQREPYLLLIEFSFLQQLYDIG
ncbi:hypothetical protein CLV59_101899 [Chitinophaga dinghuensis]|uniref:Uncharacterized protein n=1 Tax=Chitinophaga dinghuensis TaxID=1539050 RepID=A0A327WDZ6_9BACT|nr:hypothetical protein CLV59_101899 [Chitinophaga dinghuensis]